MKMAISWTLHLLIVLQIVFCKVVSLVKSVSVAVFIFKILSDGVEFNWHADTDPSNLENCEVSHAVQDSRKWTVADHYGPSDKLIALRNLRPNTTYTLFMMCKTKQGTNLRSVMVNFTTVPSGHPAEFVTSTLHPSMVYRDLITTTDIGSSVYKGHVHTGANAMDIALGVVFGLLGMAIVSVTGHYFWKKFRRRQRLRRFLQYRSEENDPFPGMVDMGDD